VLKDLLNARRKVMYKFRVEYSKLREGRPSSEHVNGSITVTADSELAEMEKTKNQLEVQFPGFEIKIINANRIK
jgi:hypothetical protein